MANMSNTHGEILLKTQNIETMEALFRAFKLQEDWAYPTYITDEFNPELVGNEFILELDFDGAGRWSYEVNIKSFCECTKDDLSEKQLKILTNNYWNIYYNFKDEEPGCAFMCEEEIELIHKPHVKYEDTLYVKCHYKDYDRNAANFLTLGFYDDLNSFIEYEIFENYGLCNEDEIKLAFKKIGDLKALTDYYGCSINELRNRFNMFEELFEIKEKLEEKGE